MKQNFRKPRLTFAFRALLLAFAATFVAGCGSTTVTRYGDAKLKRTDRNTTFDLMLSPKVVYDLDFPPVSLSKPGTTSFKVTGIKAGMIPTAVTLHYPDHLSLNKRDLADQWGNAKFQLQLTSLRSNARFEHTFTLTDTNWGQDHAIADNAHFTQPLNGYPLNTRFDLADWSNVTDYGIKITVLEPTKSGSHQVHLSGTFAEFFKGQ